MSQSRVTAIILAAGKGTRMKTTLPKVLHPVAGEPLIFRPIRACQQAGIDEIRIVVGYGKDLVTRAIEPLGALSFVQDQQKGTAHAVKSAQVETIEGTVVILNGDHPLISVSDIKYFIEEFRNSEADLAVVTCELENPGSYGRVIRQYGQVVAIVEAKDASADALEIKEVNTGLYVARAEILEKYLAEIDSSNVQQEFYLTDLIEICNEHKKRVVAIKGGHHVSSGVNSQHELSQASKEIFMKKNQSLMDEGVIIVDPACTYIEETVNVGASTVIYPGVYLKGKTKIGSYCVIEPHSMIVDSHLADNVEIKSSSYIEGSKVGSNCTVGPFARLRPDTELAEDVKIGNFVETKKVKLAKGVKASHLTYLGDAEVGEGTNIGCGTITCNYATDKKKYKTVIGKNVFVGSDTQFVAPIQIGDNSVIGSGSTITKDVPANALAVARGKQFIKENYVTKKKEG